jgi:hypothetical protein
MSLLIAARGLAVVLAAPVASGAPGPTADAPVFMVLGVAAKQANRIKFEDALAAKLAAGRLVWGGVSGSFELADVDALIDETSSMIADNIATAQPQLQRIRARHRSAGDYAHSLTLRQSNSTQSDYLQRKKRIST